MTARRKGRAKPYPSSPEMAEIAKRVSPHTVRHSLATHLLEQNIDVRVIEVLLRRAKLDTTALWTRVATKTISAVTASPPNNSLHRLNPTSQLARGWLRLPRRRRWHLQVADGKSEGDDEPT